MTYRRATGPSSAGASVLLLAFALLGCSGEEAPEASTPVAAVRPADRPLLDRSAVTLVERFQLDAPARAGLSGPRDLEFDGDGNLYVLDIGEVSRILKFDSTGNYLLRLGERDGETTQLVNAVEFDVSPWRTVLAVDRARNVLSTFLTMGFHATAIEIQGTGLDVLALPEFNEFYLHKWVPEARRVQVLHMRAPLDSLAATYTVFIPPGRTVRQEARDVFFRTAVDRIGHLYVAFYDGYPVRMLSRTGQTVRLIDLDRQPIRRSAADMAVEREKNLTQLRSGMPDVADSLLLAAAEPDSIAPVIEELVVDPLDRLWVRTNRPDAGETTSYDVFNEQGQYLARVDVPGEVRGTAFAPNGRLYVIDASGTAGSRIVGYEVRLGGETPPESPGP